jgi:hypothetical protein
MQLDLGLSSSNLVADGDPGGRKFEINPVENCAPIKTVKSFFYISSDSSAMTNADDGDPGGKAKI